MAVPKSRAPKTQYGSSQTELSPNLKINPRPDSAIVADFHVNADTDMATGSLHHTLGPSQNQAAPGDHTHDGGTSPLILSGFTLTGSRGGNAAMTSLIACLVRLGASDQTTA